MRRIYIVVVMALVASLMPTSNVKAQDFGGTVLNNDMPTWMDLYNLSSTTHNFGTARSMAMGNAFTALGADMVSASLNPAGVAMYVGGDLSFTPTISVAKSNTSDGFDNSADRTTRLVVPNFGVVVPVSMSTGVLTNVNFAVSYNRIADFNQTRTMSSLGHSPQNSLANYLCTFSNANNKSLAFDDNGHLMFGNPHYWGAVLAYDCYITNKDDEGWFIDRIGENAIVDQYSMLETRGAVDEWSFAGGFNLIDKVYLGISIGIQSIDYTRKTYYGENYLYGENEVPVIGGISLENRLNYTDYMQTTNFYGTGHNFKFGVTARPLHWLRVGVAYHTPTYYSLDIYYDGKMQTETSFLDVETGKELEYTKNDGESPYFEVYGINSWRFRTPSRLLTGVAVTLGNRAILSADYERSWYQTLRLQWSIIDDLDSVYKEYYKEVFKANNTIRLGLEYYALPAVALRAGYIWSDSAIKSEYVNAITSRPLPTTQSFLTAGLGLHLNKTTYLDFAYQYGTTHYTPIQPFYVTNGAEALIDSATFETKTTNQHFILTLGFRF